MKLVLSRMFNVGVINFEMNVKTQRKTNSINGLDPQHIVFNNSMTSNLGNISKLKRV